MTTTGEPTTDTAPGATRSRAPLWVILAAGSLVAAISLGVRSTFGLFLDPITDSLGSGRATFAFAIAVQNLLWGVGQPFAGGLADRYGSARVLAGGASLYALGIVLMANATTGLQLTLTAGVVVGLGMSAASFTVVLAAIGRLVPPERRSWALGVASAIGSAGQFVLVPVTQGLRDSVGWETTLVVLAVVAAAIVVLLRPLRGRSADAPDPALAGGRAEPLSAALGRARRDRNYLLLNLGFFVCGFHVTFIGVHLPAYLEDVGNSAAIGARALALIGLFNIAGSYLAGVLGGRHSKTQLLSLIYVGRAVVILFLIAAPAGTATSLLFAAGMGFLWLATVPLTSGIVVDHYGTTHAGSLFGIVFLAHQIGAFIGVWMGGAVADAAGTYVPMWWLAVALGLMAAVVHLFIDDEPDAEPVPLRERFRLTLPVPRPAAMFDAATGVVALGVLVLATPVGETVGDAVTDDTGRSAYSFCVLHSALPPDD